MPELQTNGENGKIIEAMIAVQSALEPLKANAKSHQGKFANLHQVMNTLQPHLTANKLAVIQVPAAASGGGCAILTRIIHEDKSEISSTITIPMQRQNDPQAYGAAMTYGRRYVLLCMFGMVTEDDDGAAASTSLEKLLRELNSCTSTEDLAKVKGDHFEKSLLTDKFLNRVYNIVYEKMYEARSGMKQ
jgi:ERF superfamily